MTNPISKIQIAGYAFTAFILFSVLHFGMIAAFFSLCVSYLLTQWFAQRPCFQRLGNRNHAISATVVGILPMAFIGVLAGVVAHFAPNMVQEFSGLNTKVIDVINRWRELMPAKIAGMIPKGDALDTVLTDTLKAQGGMIADVGKTWFGGLVQVIVGALIGVLLFVDSQKDKIRKAYGLTAELTNRAKTFIDTFRGIITAQFFIALVNTVFTALYLFVILPLFGVSMPYALALVIMTFVCGLLPIVGNLVCNVVLTLVSLSVSPVVGLASLGFLIVVHKTEYFINAAVIGKKTSTSVWELLIAIFLGEAIFGVSGLVAAPLYYAYIKRELGEAEIL